jgi:hypothetical protein
VTQSKIPNLNQRCASPIVELTLYSFCDIREIFSSLQVTQNVEQAAEQFYLLPCGTHYSNS